MGKFTLEGDTLYFGRTNERHGYNLGQLTDRSYNVMEILNPPVMDINEDGVATDKSQDADWLRARFFEQSALIEELEAENKEHIAAYGRSLDNCLLLAECYECCKTLIEIADEEDCFIGIGRNPGDTMGPGEKRMRAAVKAVQDG